ncbi:hypothetical protein [Kitasatospora sp. NPDC056731]|uniref:hypothetical protein n=1 Tax=Kitasatospora sp. NPDC056731 TaxID=3155422 RepID=UPI00342516EF
MTRTGKRMLAASAAALAGVLAVAGTASAQPGPAAVQSGMGTGEILPYPGETGLIWIPDWIGDGGAVTASVNPSQPFTVTVGCQGGGSVKVHVAGLAPADFTVQCPVGATGTDSVEIPARPGRDLLFTVTASDQAIHWGMYATQAD